MTVIVDIKNDCVNVEGNIDELGDLAMRKEDYIELFKDEAKFFIEQKISAASAYFDAASSE